VLLARGIDELGEPHPGRGAKNMGEDLLQSQIWDKKKPEHPSNDNNQLRRGALKLKLMKNAPTPF